MKKYLAIMLTVMLLASLSACGDNNNKDSSIVSENAPVQTSVSQPSTETASETSQESVSDTTSTAVSASTGDVQTTVSGNTVSDENAAFDDSFSLELNGEEYDTDDFKDITMGLTIVDAEETPGVQKLTFPKDDIGGDIVSFATDGSMLWLNVFNLDSEKIMAYDISSGSISEIASFSDDMAITLAYTGGKLIGEFYTMKDDIYTPGYLGVIDTRTGDVTTLCDIREDEYLYEELPDKLTLARYIGEFPEIGEDGTINGDLPDIEIRQIDPQTGAGRVIYTGVQDNYISDFPGGVGIQEITDDIENEQTFVTVRTDSYTITPDKPDCVFISGDDKYATFSRYRFSETPFTLYSYDIENRQRIVIDISVLPRFSKQVGRNVLMCSSDKNIKSWFYLIPEIGMAIRLEPIPTSSPIIAYGGGITAVSCITLENEYWNSIYLFKD